MIEPLATALRHFSLIDEERTHLILPHLITSYRFEPLPPILNPLSRERQTLDILYPIQAVSFTVFHQTSKTLNFRQ